ncbi:glycosyltransferase [Chryseobacterium polytrichastri]|uniref:Glycosyl transferase family 2 n=1 Tax=Chryseobacterium polytrichastri TaxID=1302687 RepID=A0A1M7BCF4_9FLAO|nr:glycosyltransferase [Chryseobacterium polytrichastri]SHL52319.1 Glycosyl transferase family 2 [Chryseobacterium polytrichastri]
MSILSRISSAFITVSYGITVNNEVEEITLLLKTLLPLIDKRDEIIVLQDITEKNQKVSDILDKYGDQIIRLEARLDGDFATFKNNLIKAARKKYLFQIDADEIPKESLIKGIKSYLSEKRKEEVLMVPRINIVNGVTDEHIERWKWKLNEEGYVNFPDYQYRIFKLNKGIVWENKVHERLRNYKTIASLPSLDYSMCLLHIKEIERQEQQNSFYDTIQ